MGLPKPRQIEYAFCQREEIRHLLNLYGSQKRPCFMLMDFKAEKGLVLSPKDCERQGILIKFPGWSNFKSRSVKKQPETLKKFPVSFKSYKMAFDYVQKEQQEGNCYLCNLTFSTDLQGVPSAEEILGASNTAYNIYLPGRFVVFSPESFVQIHANCISTFPMKGTIRADIPQAAEKIMLDKKELAEHITIVDLLRNDLSLVSRKVSVPRFRYLQKIKTGQADLLQVSSEIRGQVEEDWPKRLGDILLPLLPAGSISGAPKKKTLEIISKAENRERDFYTGIAAFFDGESLDSAVLIRYIDLRGDVPSYQSGGGITIYSRAQTEYQEMLDKVYVPFN